MSFLNRKLGAKLFVSLVLIFTISGCAKSDSSIEELSKNYKQNRDYQSLVSLMPNLNLKMTRSEVEDLLGKPTYCPVEHQCYYPSNQSVIVSCPQDSNVISKETCETDSLVLVVNYNSSNILSGFRLGPVGE